MADDAAKLLQALARLRVGEGRNDDCSPLLVGEALAVRVDPVSGAFRFWPTETEYERDTTEHIAGGSVALQRNASVTSETGTFSVWTSDMAMAAHADGSALNRRPAPQRGDRVGRFHCGRM